MKRRSFLKGLAAMPLAAVASFALKSEEKPKALFSGDVEEGGLSVRWTPVENKKVATYQGWNEEFFKEYVTLPEMKPLLKPYRG